MAEILIPWWRPLTKEELAEKVLEAEKRVNTEQFKTHEEVFSPTPPPDDE